MILASLSAVAIICATLHITTAAAIPGIVVHTSWAELSKNGAYGPSIPSNELTRRGFKPAQRADDAMWKKYVDKGQHFRCLLEATDEGAGGIIGDTRKPSSAASSWNNDLTDDLKKWYWKEGYILQEEECDFLDLQKTFAALAISPRSRIYGEDNESIDENSHNVCFNVEHVQEGGRDSDGVYVPMKPVLEQKYTVDGKGYTATNAHFKFGINQHDGAIFAKDIMSPKFATRGQWSWNRESTEGEWPLLRRGSDIMWSYWFKGNPNVKGLRMYSAHSIINVESNLLAPRAFMETGLNHLNQWPGHTFDTATDEGKALLSSPIGATIAHMLIQHKAELGRKFIPRITIVTDDFEGEWDGLEQDWHIFFHIEDVPPDADEDPDTKSGVEKPEDKNPDDHKPGVGPGKVEARTETNQILRVHRIIV